VSASDYGRAVDAYGRSGRRRARPRGETPRGAAGARRSEDSRMGQPVPGDAGTPRPERIGPGTVTGGTETSQYPEERKAIATAGVAASETARAQTDTAEWPAGLCGAGVVRPAWGRGSRPRRVRNRIPSRTPLEGATGAGESPVGERGPARRRCVSTAAPVQCGGKLGRPRSKAKHPTGPIAQSTARER